MQEINLKVVRLLLVSLSIGFSQHDFRLVNQREGYFEFKDLNKLQACNFQLDPKDSTSSFNGDIVMQNLLLDNHDYFEISTQTLHISGRVENDFMAIRAFHKGQQIYDNQINEILFSCLSEISQKRERRQYFLKVEVDGQEFSLDLAQYRYMLPWAFEVLPTLNVKKLVRIEKTKTTFLFDSKSSDFKMLERVLSRLDPLDTYQGIIIIRIDQETYSPTIKKLKEAINEEF